MQLLLLQSQFFQQHVDFANEISISFVFDAFKHISLHSDQFIATLIAHWRDLPTVSQVTLSTVVSSTYVTLGQPVIHCAKNAALTSGGQPVKSLF